MSANAILIMGAASIALAVTLFVFALTMGSAQPTGVARSLAVINRLSNSHDVARQELPQSVVTITLT